VAGVQSAAWEALNQPRDGSAPAEQKASTLRWLAAVSLLTDLDAFSTEHMRSGDLDGGVEGPIVWIVCECGARMARRVEERDALAFND
jgi:hypothetical protein